MKPLLVKQGWCVLGLLLLLGCSERASDAVLHTEGAPEARARLAATAAPETIVTAADTLELPATNRYEITTPLGRMVVRLFDETPVHRDNFKKLVAEQAYDSTLFHRVIRGFMIQGGDPNSLDDNPMDDGSGGPGYTLPAEVQPDRYHTRGALAAARQGDPVNPERRSSGSQFYLVQGGNPLPDSILALIVQDLRRQIPDADFSFPDSVREAYRTEGGAPFLDGQYTIFGELVEGYDVLDRIAGVATPRATGQRTPAPIFDRPFDAIWMVIRPLPASDP